MHHPAICSNCPGLGLSVLMAGLSAAGNRMQQAYMGEPQLKPMDLGPYSQPAASLSGMLAGVLRMYIAAGRKLEHPGARLCLQYPLKVGLADV